MTTHNKYSGEIKESLGGKERVFKMTFERIVHLEDSLGQSIMDIARNMSSGQFSVKSIAEVLYQALLGAGGKYEKNAIGKMVMEDGIVRGAEIASKVLATLFTTKEEQDSESPLVQGENQSKETTLSKSTSK